MRRGIGRTAAAVALLLVCHPSSAANRKPRTPGPKAILAEVADRGAEATVSRLWTSGQWEAVMAHIAEGKDEWLKVAAALRPGTDAGATEGLFIVLGEVLARNPRGVLAILGDGLDASMVCSANMMVDDLRYRTKALVLREMDRRIEAVSPVKNAALKSIKGECLGQFEKDWKRVELNVKDKLDWDILCDGGYAVYEIVFCGRRSRCRPEQLESKLFRLDVRDRIDRFRDRDKGFRARVTGSGPEADMRWFRHNYGGLWAVGLDVTVRRVGDMWVIVKITQAWVS